MNTLSNEQKDIENLNSIVNTVKENNYEIDELSKKAKKITTKDKSKTVHNKLDKYIAKNNYLLEQIKKGIQSLKGKIENERANYDNTDLRFMTNNYETLLTSYQCVLTEYQAVQIDFRNGEREKIKREVGTLLEDKVF